MIRKSRTGAGWKVPTSREKDENQLVSPDFLQESPIADISFSFENPLKERFGENFFRDLPKDPGVYTFIDAKGQPLYIGKANNLKADMKVGVEFRLSHIVVKDGFTTFGCFRHRGKAKASYSALMRLCFAAFCPRERFQIPSKICRSSPAYRYSTELPYEATEHIENYLAGRNNDVLRYLLDTLLARENFPKPLYLPMQRDLETLKEFYVYGPQDTAKLAKRLRLKTGIVPQDVIDTHVSTQFFAGL